MSRQRQVTGLYNQEYARGFEKLYLDKLPEKHLLNILNLKRIITALPQRRTRWLDLACGQAWHFSQFRNSLTRIGVDLSIHQLDRARKRNPSAAFARADISEIIFPANSFDLVTNFWAGYCYLDDQSTILKVFERACTWLRPGGALYLEVLAPEDVAMFNSSKYARGTGFRVEGRTPDHRKWAYFDPGGRHNMTSPPLQAFVDTFQPHFHEVESKHDTGFMFHTIGWNRC